MFRQSLELSDTDWGAERREERGEGGHVTSILASDWSKPDHVTPVLASDWPRFRRSDVTSSDHFEKRKLGRIVSKLSGDWSMMRMKASDWSRLEILEEREDDDDEEDDLERRMVNETQEATSPILRDKVCLII